MKKFIAFVRLWIWFTLRELKAHRWQTLAVLFGIALGASVYGSVRVAVIASVDSFSRSMDAIVGSTDRSLVAPGGRIPESLVAQVLKIPGVTTASPFLSAYVRSSAHPENPVLLIGLDPLLDRPLRPWAVNPEGDASTSDGWLDLLRIPYSCMISDTLAREWSARTKDSLGLENHLRRESFTVAGILSSQGLALANSGRILLTDISSFQEFMDLHGLVDRIDILLEPGVTAEDLERALAPLPGGVHLELPGEEKESGKSLIQAYQLNLSVLSFVSLFVGMFLVFSLVALHATSRRHEIAVLRSIGTSPSTIFCLFLLEGAFLGMLGWILSLPLSFFFVRKLLTHVSSTVSHLFVRTQVDAVRLDALEIFLSLVMTLAVSLLAASQPAWEAKQVPPGEILAKGSPKRTAPKFFRILAWLGAALILISRPLSQLPAVAGIPLPGYASTFFLFAGFSLLAPWLLGLSGTVLPALLRRIGGEPAHLGARYVRDAGGRSAISVGALITAVGLFVALVIMIYSFRSTVETWVHQTIAGDLFIRPSMAEMNDYRDPLPDSLVAALEARQPALRLSPYRRIYLREGTQPYQLEAIDFEEFLQHSDFLMTRGNLELIEDRLKSGEGVLISEVFSNRMGLGPGDRFRALVDGLSLDLPILGVFRDYRTRGGIVHYSLPHLENRTGSRVWSGVRVFTPDGVSGAQALMSELMRIEGLHHGLVYTLGEDLRGGILAIFDETFAVTSALLLIALIVAGLGITTTLAVLVLERSREIHTLVAVGASRMQVRLMILWEALILVCLGELAGLACGFSLSHILVFEINRQSFGWTFLYSVGWAELLFALPLILSTALMAALPAGQIVFRRSTASTLRE